MIGKILESDTGTGSKCFLLGDLMKNRRKWKTTDGQILFALEAEKNTFQPIGGMAELRVIEAAFVYQLINPDSDEIITIYRGSEIYSGRYKVEYMITKYIVKNNELLKCEFRYYEESTFDIPNVYLRQSTVELTGLLPL